MTSTRPVLLLGATGTVGRAVAAELAATDQPVVAFGRQDPTVEGVVFAPGAVTRIEDLARVLTRHRPRAIVSCLASRSGAPQEAWAIDHDAHIGVLAAAHAAGIGQFVLLSAICVQKPRLAFQHAKLAFEAALCRSGLTYSIVRPTALFKSLSGQLARVQTGKPYLMFGDGRLTACKPISDRDLARFMVSCLHMPERQNRILPIGGPGPALTPQEMGAALFRLTGKTPQYRRVPPALLSAVAGGLALGGRISPRLRAKAELARIGQYYATESMLVWDPVAQRYDAEATPSFGSETLFDHYRDLIAGKATHDLGDHAVF